MSARALGGIGNVTKAALSSGIGGSLVIERPSNTSNADYLMAVVYARGESAPLAPPAGWTRVNVAMPNTTIGQVNTFYKRITNVAAEPASYAFPFTGGNRKSGMIFRVTGGHPTRFVLAESASDITYGGTLNTSIVAPAIPMRDSLALTIIGTNYSAPLVPPTSWTDEIGSTKLDTASTSTGSGETVVYVSTAPLATRDSLGVNHATLSPGPSSGVAYMLVLGSAGVSPEITLGGAQSTDAGARTTVPATVLAGVVNEYEWRVVGTTPPGYAVAADGKSISFTAPKERAGPQYTFECRGRDANEPGVYWSAWSRGTVKVRNHQVWVATNSGTLAPVTAPPLWTFSNNSLVRPGDVYVPDGITVPQLLARSTFYSAHRGGGDEFPEHTMEAYQGAVAGGLDAIEVSVRVTSDGVMVCFHDDTLDRTTNATGPIGERTYQDLYDNVRVARSAILGEGQPGVRIPKVEDVLERFAGKKIIFLEGKDGQAHAQLFAELDKFASRGIKLGDWFIQKQFFRGGSWTKSAAIERGIKVWGYMGVDTTDADLDTEDYRTDLWGVPDFMPLERKAEIVRRGKPVICWEVHRRAQVEEHQSIGLQGQMSSSAMYVSRQTQRQITDTFASRRKAPGDMWTANIAVDNLALTYDGKGGASHKSPNPICTTVMGSMCPVREGATIRATMSWAVAPVFGASGIAFGARNDDIFRPAADFENKVGGYYLSVNGATSTATLYKYNPGLWSPIELATTSIAPRNAGDPINIQLSISASGPTAVVGGKTLTSSDKTYTGKYFHIAQGNCTTLTTFSKISV